MHLIHISSQMEVDKHYYLNEQLDHLFILLADGVNLVLNLA